MVHYLVRPYLDKDFEDYANTLLKTWPFEDIQEARNEVAGAVKRAEEGKEEIWVAKVDRRAEGFMVLEFTNVWEREGEVFEKEGICIDWLDVHPDFQRKGIGKDLLRKAEERAIEKGLRRLFAHTKVTNLAMINFASKNGFRFERHLKEFWGKGTGDAFLLVKEL